MALNANSYGTVAEVAALAPRWTSSGSYSASTQPTTEQVEKFIDRVSAVLNTFLAEAGFDIPVDDTYPKLVCDHFVVEHAAALCDAVNNAGVYIPGQNNNLRGKTPDELIREAAARFVAEHADGLERLGADRDYSAIDGLECRTTDAAGDTIAPIFSRRQMSNTITDWDVS